ncbi:serine hydrolase domain-containing protein [Comamonas composti]|uniref:serine hydrolase domain-containing protein n=1 Tax=Comamonas composti TaxID=408558 RepID=UPI00040A017D|nr:serine hydrolase domain-containing protein [Comamonas composti]
MSTTERLQIPGLPWAATPESQGLCSQRLERLSERLSRGVADREIPGALALVARRGQLAYLQSFGLLNPAQNLPMRCDAIFRIASMSKPITSLAIMMLAEEGQLCILDPVVKYLPELSNMQVGRVQTGADGASRIVLEPLVRAITLQDLLRHTAGVTYGVPGSSNPLKQAYIDARLGHKNDSNAVFITKLSGLALLDQPGTSWEYGMSTDVLGRVVEVVSGLGLDEFVRSRICEPLGLRDTGFEAPETEAGRAAWAQPEGPQLQMPPIPPVTQALAFKSGGGGMVSTIADYARLCLFWRNGGQLDGTRLVSRKTVELMTANHLPPGTRMGPDMAQFGSQLPSPEMGTGFGLGFAVRTATGLNPLPGSVGDYSWSGIYGTFFWVDPQEDLFAILMMQSMSQRIPYRMAMRQAVYQALMD